MPPEPDGHRTKKRREKLLGLGLIQKNVWVPAALASALMAFALQLRRQAEMLLPSDPPEGEEATRDHVMSKLVDGQAPIVQQAAAKLARDKSTNGPRVRAKRSPQ